MKSQCKNPDHEIHVAGFIKKYPSAKGKVPQTIILVDPKDWAVALENPTFNTTECCQQNASIAGSIAQAKKGIGVTESRTIMCLSVGSSILTKIFVRRNITYPSKKFLGHYTLSFPPSSEYDHWRYVRTRRINVEGLGR